MTYGTLAQSGAGASPPDDLASMMLALPGLLAYWKLDEESGTTAVNAEGTAARDGAYMNSPTLASVSFPSGGAAPLFDGALNGQYADVFTASLAAAFDGDLGWLNMFVQLETADNANTTARQILAFQADSDNYLTIERLNLPYLWRLAFEGGNLRRRNTISVASPKFQMITITWDRIWGYVSFFVNGLPFVQDAAVNAFVGDLAIANIAHGANPAGAFGLKGSAGHVAVGTGEVPTAAALRNLWAAAYADGREFTVVGDSKSSGDKTWIPQFQIEMETETGNAWRENPGRRYGLSGEDSIDLHTFVDANLPSEVGSPEFVLLNIGSNDLFNVVTESTFKTNVTGIIDAYLAKFPATIVYVAKPWRQTYDAAATTMAGWIDDVIATYTSGVAVGHDENVWMKGADDGATMTSDGIHYSDAGNAECAAQWMTALGY